MTAVTALPWDFMRYPVGNNAPVTAGNSNWVSSLFKEFSNKQSASARNPALLAVHELLDEMLALADDWDGHGSLKPSSGAVSNARRFLEGVYKALKSIGASWK